MEIQKTAYEEFSTQGAGISKISPLKYVAGLLYIPKQEISFIKLYTCKNMYKHRIILFQSAGVFFKNRGQKERKQVIRNATP